MAALKPVLNVHVIPIGLEIDRAVLPLKETKVDRVYLVFQKNSKDVIKFFLDAVKKQLRKKIGLKEEEIIEANYEKWDDLQGIMAKICQVVKKEREDGNKVFVNISSGGKLLDIAGTLAASMYGAQAYYVVPKHYKNFERGEVETTGLGNIVEIPEYKIVPPSDELVYALWIINNYEVTSQKTVAYELAKKGLLRTEDEKGKKLSPQALHVLFRRRFLNPLEGKGWIVRDGQRRGARISLTEDGKNVLKIFEGSNRFIS